MRYSLLFLILLSSCKVAYRTLLGVDTTPEWKSETALEQDFDRWSVASEQRFLMDTAGYTDRVVADAKMEFDQLPPEQQRDSVFEKKFRKVVNDNLQPVQIRYFDHRGKPVFKMVNCYLDGLRLDWNAQGAFDELPPRAPDSLLLRGNRPLDYFLPHLSRPNGKKLTLGDLPTADYYVLFFFNDILIKPSRKARRALQSLHTAHPESEVFVLYVNNHNEQIWGALSEEQRRLVRELR